MARLTVKSLWTQRVRMSRDASPIQSGSPGDAGRGPGYAAETPTEIPPGGWFQILRRSLKEIRNDHLTLIAGGVAYSWFLALFPGLIAAVLIYGLVTLITTQLKSIAGGSGPGINAETEAQTVRDTTTGDPRRWVRGEPSRPTNLRQRVDLRLQVQCTSPCAVSSS
jgi:hypothetical protein